MMKKRRLAIMLLVACLASLACLIPLASADTSGDWQIGDGWDGIFPTPGVSSQLTSSASVMASLFVVVAIFVGLAAARRVGDDSASGGDEGLFGPSSGLLSYVVCIAILLLFAAIIAGMGFVAV